MSETWWDVRKVQGNTLRALVLGDWKGLRGLGSFQ